jgi:predicted pyridoxine 5'-phosphate oxidase superfamily flavin-nucleotide-binding protein
MTATSPFHAGEQWLQSHAGVRERLEAVGQVALRDHMPDQHRELFGKLPTLFVAAQDAEGRPWATLLHGAPGFVTTPDARTLRVAARLPADDPLTPWLVEGAAVGILGLEPHTRRRNRANGRVRTVTRDALEIAVQQSFGNCPKYIHAREPQAAPRPSPPPAAERLGPALNDAALALLRRADTLFIASASAARLASGDDSARSEGVDVSHRGGRPGFLRVEAGAAAGSAVRLTMPDYTGNFFFNTLGNLVAWPKAGLLVPDYADGSLLHLAADARVELEGEALAEFPGALRLLRLDLRAGWWRERALPLRWSAPVAPVQFAA